MTARDVCILISLALLLAAPAAAQQSKTFGDWTVIALDDRGGLLAADVGEGGSIGFACFTKDQTCMFNIDLGESCVEGGRYPILVNGSGEGAAAMTGRCSITDGHGYMIAENYNQFRQIIMANEGYIGFALPMASGQFKVVRIQTRGAKAAIEATEGGVREAARRSGVEYK
jgi:hypothetical protein